MGLTVGRRPPSSLKRYKSILRVPPGHLKP